MGSEPGTLSDVVHPNRSNPGERGSTIFFPPLYLYLANLYRFGRRNITDLHTEVSVNLTDALTLTLAEHFFWRQNTHVGIYDLTDAVVRCGNTSSARTIGNEFDISLN